MSVPIELQDLSVLLGVNAIVLLLTSEMLSPEHGSVRIHVNRRRLRIAALAVSVLFLITVIIRTFVELAS